jgi:hypothetical protein
VVTIYKVPLNRLGHGDEIWQVHYYIVYAIDSVCVRARSRSQQTCDKLTRDFVTSLSRVCSLTLKQSGGKITSLSRVCSLTLKQSGGQIHNRMRVLHGACARNRWWHNALIAGPQILPGCLGPATRRDSDPQRQRGASGHQEAMGRQRVPAFSGMDDHLIGGRRRTSACEHYRRVLPHLTPITIHPLPRRSHSPSPCPISQHTVTHRHKRTVTHRHKRVKSVCPSIEGVIVLMTNKKPLLLVSFKNANGATLKIQGECA